MCVSVCRNAYLQQMEDYYADSITMCVVINGVFLRTIGRHRQYCQSDRNTRESLNWVTRSVEIIQDNIVMAGLFVDISITDSVLRAK